MCSGLVVSNIQEAVIMSNMKLLYTHHVSFLRVAHTTRDLVCVCVPPQFF